MERTGTDTITGNELDNESCRRKPVGFRQREGIVRIFEDQLKLIRRLMFLSSILRTLSCSVTISAVPVIPNLAVP